jgi:hypothetical protein
VTRSFWRVELEFDADGAPNTGQVKQFVLEAMNAYVGSLTAHDDVARALEDSEFRVRYVHSATQAHPPQPPAATPSIRGKRK